MDGECLRLIREEDFGRSIENYWERFASDDDAVLRDLHSEIIEKLYCVKTIGEFFDSLGKTYGELPALIDVRDAGTMAPQRLPTLSYRELAEAIARKRSLLASMGITRGTEVGFLGENSPEFLTTLVACMGEGAIAVPFAGRAESGQTPEEAMERAEVAFVFLDPSGVDAALAADPTSRLGRLCRVGHVSALGWEAEQKLSGHAFGRMLRQEKPPEDRGKCAEDPILRIFSSGTTGMPSLVTLRHCDLLHPALTLPARYNQPPGKRTLEMMPLYHIYGIETLLCALAGGSKVYLADGTSMKQRGEAVLRAARPHFMPMVPYALIMLRRRIEATLQEKESKGGLVQLCVRCIREAVSLHMVKVANEDIRLSKKLGMQRDDLREAFRYWKPVRAKRFHIPQGVLAGVRRAIGRLLITLKVLPDAGLEHLTMSNGLLISGGAKIDPETLAFFCALGVNVIPGYGTTDDPIISAPLPGRREPLTCSGVPSQKVSFKECDDGVWEIVIPGGSKTDEEGNVTAMEKRTNDCGGFVMPEGDITRMSSDPYILVHGRRNNTVKLSSGFFADLSAYEREIMQGVSGIAHVIVMPSEDPETHGLCAYLIPQEDGDCSSDLLSEIQAITENLAKRSRACVTAYEVLSGAPTSKEAIDGGRYYSLKGEPKRKELLKAFSHRKDVDEKTA